MGINERVDRWTGRHTSSSTSRLRSWQSPQLPDLDVYCRGNRDARDAGDEVVAPLLATHRRDLFPERTSHTCNRTESDASRPTTT
jgi:hypothetical protein